MRKLRIVLLRTKQANIQKAIQELRDKQVTFETREAELEEAIGEAQTEEEQKTVEEAVNAFETEKAENVAELSKLEGELADVETELKDTEAKAQEAVTPKVTQEVTERKENKTMEKRYALRGLSVEETTHFMERDAVKGFVERFREFAQKRNSVQGAELSIPMDVLGLIREIAANASKLNKYVNKQTVSGESRQVVMGTIPEAVWTDMVGKINKLEVVFNAAEVDGYKVAGFIGIPSAILEDNDINLLQNIIDMLGASLGAALDKAYLYGKGVKMPLGVVTRLAQTLQPESYSSRERAWADLHTSNILKFDGATKKGADFFAEILKAGAVPKSKYSVKQVKVWCMNTSTYATIKAKALAVNSAGAFVAQDNQIMPADGGPVETFDFIPDGDIIVGYFDLYLSAERAGAIIKTFDQTLALDDELLVIGSARYDGKPVIAEGFAAVNIANGAVTTTAEFAADTANIGG